MIESPIVSTCGVGSRVSAGGCGVTEGDAVGAVGAVGAARFAPSKGTVDATVFFDEGNPKATASVASPIATAAPTQLTTRLAAHRRAKMLRREIIT